MAVPKKILIKSLGLGTLILVGAALSWVVFFPGTFLKQVAPQILSKAGIDPQQIEIEGNLFSRIVIRGLDIRQNNMRLRIRELAFHLKLKDLIKREVTITELWVTRPLLSIYPSQNDKKKKPETVPFIPNILKASLTNGRVEFITTSTSTTYLQNINSNFHLVDAELRIARARFQSFASTVSLQGILRMNPLSAHLSIDSAGWIEASGSVQGKPLDWDIKLDGTLGGSRIKFLGKVKEEEKWNAQVQLDEFRPQTLPVDVPSWLPSLSGSVFLRGKGFKQEGAEGTCRGVLSITGGPQIRGKIIHKQNQTNWNITVSSGEVAGFLKGNYAWNSKEVDANGSLVGHLGRSSGGLVPSSGSVRIKGFIRGNFPTPKWAIDGISTDFVWGNVQIRSISIQAKGNSPLRHQMSFNTKFKHFSQNNFILDEGELAIIGGISSHTIVAKVRKSDSHLIAKGVGRWEDQKWEAKWRKISGKIGQELNLKQPCRTVFGRGDWVVQDFRLLFGAAQIGFDAVRTGEQWSQLNGQLMANQMDIFPLIEFFFPSSIKMGSCALTTNMKISYQKKGWDVLGALDLASPDLQIEPLGLALRDLNVRLEAQGNHIRVSDGSAVVSKPPPSILKFWKRKKVVDHPIHLSGQLSWAGPDLKLHSPHLYFSSPEGLSGDAALDLSLTRKWAAPHLAGRVLIHEAHFRPPKKKARKKTKQAPSGQPSVLSTDIQIQFDRNVWFKDGATAIEIKGLLDVKKNSLEPLLIFGSIETIRGDYDMYGLAFKIERGKIQFTENHQSDALLNAKAVYTQPQSKVKVFAHMDGTVSNPNLVLTSDPPMEDQDILSVLITGKPLYDLQGEDNKIQREAVEAVIGNYLLKDIQTQAAQKAGIDVLRVKSDQERNVMIEAGSYVHPKVYVSYSQAVAAGGQRLISAEYLLSQIWSLEGRTSTDGLYIIDLLYKYGIK